MNRKKLEKQIRHQADLATILGSALFDADWYLKNYPDVAAAQTDPASHYLDHGATEGRNPGPCFSTRAYFSRRRDVEVAGLNPLLHFLRHGLAELSSSNLDDLLTEVAALGVSLTDLAQQPHQIPRIKAGPLAVFVTHDANVGGAPAVLASIASWFSRHTDYRVKIVCMEGGGWIGRFKSIAPTYVVGTRSVQAHDVDAYRSKLHEFLGEAPAFTFINSVASGDYCILDPFDAPRIAYVHELPRILDMFPEQVQRLRNTVSHIFCASAPVSEALVAHSGFERAILSVRQPFVESVDTSIHVSAAEKTTHRRVYGWDDETPIVMGCGVVHWRKQPEVFVRAAAALKDLARFVWVGDGEDLQEMRTLATSLGLGDRLEFLGNREDSKELLACADIFALTSLEDPFPLVCLEAGLGGAPSVIFREAGGMFAFVEPDGEPPAGIAVPLGDESAYTEALRTLLSDHNLRAEMGHTAHVRVAEHYTADRGCKDVLATIRQVLDLPPRVSVLVPVYNSSKYLKERLNSIENQTFKDVEIIIYDDASQDGSLNIINEFASGHTFARVGTAAQNGGSVFLAWERCLYLASGDLVWIAEADDSCEPTFLEQAIVPFAQSGMRLVHGRSIPIDHSGKISGDYESIYLDHIARGRWKNSYVATAIEEINAALGRGSSIPNASAVVVRRSAALRAIRVARTFSLAGDWAFYVTAIYGGRIGFAADAVNYHRRHDTTVTKGIEGTDLYFQELADVGVLIRKLYGRNSIRDSAFLKRLEGEAKRFDRRKPLPEGRMPPEAPQLRPAVLYGVGDLSGGGAQMFAVRFVNGWVASGGSAVLFTTGQEPNHPAVAGALSPEVPILTANEVATRGLSATLRDWGLDLVVTGHWWADRAVGIWQDAEPTSVPWAIVMHGCYENVLDSPTPFQDHVEVFARAERYCGSWVWTADKNRRLFEQGWVRPRSERNIINGFEPVKASGLTRSAIGLPNDGVVFTLASRAIEEKGWFAAYTAFTLLRQKGHDSVHLVLIGDGPAAAAIAKRGEKQGLHLVPHTRRLADYIALSDVCLLPSWFAGESQPLVLIEFLAQGKPCIVSDIGMCPWIIEAESRAPAGFVVSRRKSDGTVAPEDLAAAMTHLASDSALRAAFAIAAKRAFEKFDFGVMLEAYRDAFSELLGGTQ